VSAYVEPNQPVIRRRTSAFCKGSTRFSASPADRSHLGRGAGLSGFCDPLRSQDQLTEMYEVPWNDPKNPDSGFSPAARI